MSDEWKTRTLGNICDEVNGTIKTGPFGSQLHQSDYRPEGVPVVMPINIVDSRISTENIAYIGEEDAERLSHHKMTVGDIVYGRRGDIGRQALITEREQGWLCGTGCLRISLGDTILDPVFLHYYLRDYQVIGWICNQAIGATLPNLNTAILRSVPITYPPLETQRKIASILSAYDDLIENNTRRIHLLEQTAHDLYREWFVHFRFPGHENVEMVDGLPSGWEIKPIGDAIETTGGGTPSTKNPEYWEGGDVVWYVPSDLTAAGTMFTSDSCKHITRLGLQKSSARLFPAYSVMMTSRATIGVTAINTVEACTNQGFITCIPNDRLSAYQIYFWIQENLETILSVASGATFKEITRSTFRKMPIAIPDTVTNSKFIELLTPIGKQIQNLQRKNANLRQTRDLLLPRLVSGEVDVAGLEIPVGENIS